MQILTKSKIDFMKLARFFVPLSVVLALVSAVLLSFGQLNLGIDFAGGTQLVLRFREEPVIDEIRDLMSQEGLDDALIQRFGQAGDNELIIKTRLVEGQEEGSRERVVGRLESRFNPIQVGLDLNQQGSASVASFLLERDPDGKRDLPQTEMRAHYDSVAASIMDVRRDKGLIDSWDELEGAAGVSPEVLETLRAEARLGAFTVLSTENVGPQIGDELRTKGILAVVFSLLGMLAYIWARFELRYGLGALAAVGHDVVIALGFYVVLGYEFNLTTIAAFLTLVGYSVNDSVVIFDRVRENLRLKRRESLSAVINISLNQTLARTILTSGTTLLALGTMFFLGGDVLRGFSFVLSIGVMVGTYSSIFVASPVLLAWERVRGRAR